MTSMYDEIFSIGRSLSKEQGSRESRTGNEFQVKAFDVGPISVQWANRGGVWCQS
jgi:hypothetical protein